MEHPGRAISVMREAQGLRLRELARLAHVNASYLSQVERGKAEPTDRWLRSVTDALVRNMTKGAA